MLKGQIFTIKVKLIISAVLMIFVLSSCAFISNSLKYKGITKEFVEDLLHKDYDKCINLIDKETIKARGISIDTMKLYLAEIRNNIVGNFGDKLNYSFVKSEKKFSTNKEDNTPPHSTEFYLQIDNDREFGIIHVVFDDHSNKILELGELPVKGAIPDMKIFWLFGLLAICIPIFNIYVIIKVKQSQLKRKWLMYLAIILINVPTIGYSPINGLSFELLSFQGLFGVGFSYYGYLGAVWEFGIPLGGIFCLWRIKTKKAELNEQTELIPENHIFEEENNETTEEKITE